MSMASADCWYRAPRQGRCYDRRAPALLYFQSSRRYLVHGDHPKALVVRTRPPPNAQRVGLTELSDGCHKVMLAGIVSESGTVNFAAKRVERPENVVGDLEVGSIGAYDLWVNRDRATTQ